MNPKQALWILIAGLGVRPPDLCDLSLGLGNDEAYHFLYAAHPALSYYDHPPMMAWVEMAGLALSARERPLGPCGSASSCFSPARRGSWRG